MSADCYQQCPASEATDYGSDWFGDDRESMNDVAKYYNNTHLSDISLLVGDETFPAHRLILAKSSEVFDRMFSHGWNGDKKEMELVEETICHKSFPAFLRFLYCNHVVLHPENCLPLLILADKYNVSLLKKVCLDFAQSEILPRIDTNELFTIWFSYATKAYHPSLIRACMEAISFDFETLLTEDWEKRWQSLDRDQMVEILKCNSLKFSNEYKLWEGILKWIQAPNHPERRGNTASPLLTLLLPLVRFPYMSPDELSLVEKSSIAESYPKLFLPPILLAYKYHALPLSSRLNCKEFSTKQFLLRRYEDIRWDRRITLDKALIGVPGVDHSFTFMTRSSSYPTNDWKWILKLTGRTFSNTNDSDHLRMLLIAEDIDQSRSVEYMLQIVDGKKIVRSFSGKKTFTKTRYSSEVEMEKKIEFGDLLNDDSSLLCNGELILQLFLRPID
uniref:BTB domain-containing protein n=1 Tax=Caenorhabditis japonica TaxID=281687 RepID=A0A8R1E3L5_CAEJA